VTTRGLDLLGLPAGTRLRLGEAAVVEVTGLRNPCKQLEGVQPGLMRAVLGLGGDGELVRKAGVMGVVVAGGEVRAGDPIEVVERPGHGVTVTEASRAALGEKELRAWVLEAPALHQKLRAKFERGR
jgi:MOSC domain-containing protein YiiM